MSGTLLDVERNYLVVASNSIIKRVSKSSGAITGSINVVNNCSDVALDRNGDIFFTGNNGTSKIVNTSITWNLPQILGEKLDVKNGNIWLYKNLLSSTNPFDSVAFFELNSIV